MPPLEYHEGQRAVQHEAQTVGAADNLIDWVGPAVQFANEADLVLLAVDTGSDALPYSIISGPPPLFDTYGEEPISLTFGREIATRLPEGKCGGLAISMSTARRARLNGTLVHEDAGATLTTSESFTNCRKYIAPSAGLGESAGVGPASRDTIDLRDPEIAQLIAGAETAFLATISPERIPDVSHRGGPPGFIDLDQDTARISWPEYVGDGMFKSAGNIRSTGIFTLLIPDFTSGDAIELVGWTDYTNTRPERRPRSDPLVRHREPFPQQGYMEGEIAGTFRLTEAFHRRERIERRRKVTSEFATEDQAPK